ncbi:hypothetical protein ACLMJK_005473 [Lecanora helva]
MANADNRLLITNYTNKWTDLGGTAVRLQSTTRPDEISPTWTDYDTAQRVLHFSGPPGPSERQSLRWAQGEGWLIRTLDLSDRKPVDPPPIVQLRIKDPEDPAQNYLQSPYFFMVVNLQDANSDRSEQLAAAHQGEDIDTSSQSALAGTLVSSLHRLKDVDNTGK